MQGMGKIVHNVAREDKWTGKESGKIMKSYKQQKT